MKSTDLIKELIAAGCELRRHNGGSHQIWWSPITGKTFPVPHPKKRFTARPCQIHQKNGGDLILAFLEATYVFLSGCRDTKR
ncbi:HicA-like toxin of HicAB toxin-antitoxin system|uniref:HicA-like toxin of HicAB toxin-antitoxin system n=1 Tax=Brenneria salicis ATCC 15712 = DSM 30166 TaxID=714314 RepID=A0A366HYY4_9GAMM|nr:HicA-like toxin of HicAB toxin-antitoxin system [Brenneria salicis ATCC 15712 = DSM 30166]RBP59351.1 HicA-like toxin of HicAB toxin-antitoxin system [Brenneria salicis ATCC 15712 = DSM 30166]